MAERAMNESQEYSHELSKRVKAANKNLSHRIRSEGMEIAYDPDSDFLSVKIGAPKPAEAIYLHDGTRAVAMIDPETSLIAAIEAPFFMEDLRV